MPWEVREHEGQWCVFVEGEEEPIEGGCHDSPEEAEDHLQALYADDELKMADDLADDLAGDLVDELVEELEEALDEEPVDELAEGLVEDLVDEVEEALEEEPVAELAEEVLDEALEELLIDELKATGEGEEEEDKEEEENEDEQPEKRTRSTKSPTLLTTFEAEIHRQFTLMADSFYANGNLTRDERIALSSAIGDALSAFTTSLEGLLPPEVLGRSPYLDVLPEGAPVIQKSTDRLRAIWMASKGIPGPVVVRRVMKSRAKPLPAKLAIKSLGRNRIGGYLCLWGSPNLKDLTGEWFAPDTAELTTVFDAIGAIPALYHHAGDKLIKSMVPALVDVMEKDETGLWIEAQIQKRREYDNFIAPLVDQGALGWSSGTLPQARRVDKSTGKILRWPIVEASMTPTPAEWRMAVQWPVTNLKALYRQAGLALPGRGPAKRTASKARQASAIRQELERLRRLAR